MNFFLDLNHQRYSIIHELLSRLESPEVLGSSKNFSLDLNHWRYSIISELLSRLEPPEVLDHP